MKIRQYRFSEVPIGKGTNGKVYKGEHVKTKAPVAIKELPNNRHTRMEYSIMRKYHRHKYLPRVHKLMLVKDKAYLVMDWINGENLGYRHRGSWYGEKHSIKDAVLITIRVLQALSYLHSKGIVYGDINPSNLLVRSGTKYDLKIIDFGSASLTSFNYQAHKDIVKCAYLISFLLNGYFPYKRVKNRTKLPKALLKIRHRHLLNDVYQAVHPKVSYRYKTPREFILKLRKYAK